MKLIIGNKNYSSWSLRAWLLMRQFNVDFSQQYIRLFTNDMIENMTGLCPNYKVPVLIDNRKNELGHCSVIKIWDSLAICEYVNEQYLDGKAWPKCIEQRATARSICAEMHAGFLNFRQELPMNCRRHPAAIAYSPETQQEINRIIALLQECLQACTTNNEGFLFGKFSIADAYYMPVVARFTSYQIIVPEDIKQYMELMLTLPAYQQWQVLAEQEVEVIESGEV
ncbi:MAG: glutathione S-transferase family protein [Colwellia sp.]|nr:glutathione S-transferase family protein [Colwellia sp.]